VSYRTGVSICKCMQALGICRRIADSIRIQRQFSKEPKCSLREGQVKYTDSLGTR
jgi:hypothetical protein